MEETNILDKESVSFQLDLLWRDGYHNAARIIKALQGKVDSNVEMERLKQFARQNCFDEELARDQFRCLWTAYCIHQGLLYGTVEYTNDIFELWNAVAEDESETADWGDYGTFIEFMGKFVDVDGHGAKRKSVADGDEFRCSDCGFWKNRDENGYGTCTNEASPIRGYRTLGFHCCDFMNMVNNKTDQEKRELERRMRLVVQNCYYGVTSSNEVLQRSQNEQERVRRTKNNGG